jgi:hypothetical protein
MYQYYSKHIHPSSWLINNLHANLQSTATKIVFRAIAIEDALDAVEYLSVASQQLLKVREDWPPVYETEDTVSGAESET